MSLTRRRFLEGALVGGGFLSLGFNVGCSGAAARMLKKAEDSGEFTPNMFVTVLADGGVGVAINKSEFGQGITTGYATLVAEELEIGVESVAFRFADSAPEYRTSFGMHQTGGSTSTAEAFLPVRRAAAAAREMLASAAATKWNVPVSDVRAQGGKIVHAASGRSLGYGELTRDAARLPVPAEPKLKPRAEFKLIGKQGNRVDLSGKVTGTTQFGIDVVVPDMLRAVAIHPPVFGAEPLSFKADEARKRPGVVDVVSFPWGVAVVAQKHWQALAASKLVQVDWSRGAAAGLDTEKLRAAMRANSAPGTRARDDGDVDAAIAGAATKVDVTYDVPYVAHATMEPQNCTVHVTPGKAEVWAPCQSPTIIQETLAQLLGIGREDVLVHTTYLGGGFGRRAMADFAVQAASIAQKVGRPVQLLWTRESDMTGGFYRPIAAVHLRGGVAADGKPVAIHARIVAPSMLEAFSGALPAVLPTWLPGGLSRSLAASMKALSSTGSIADLLGTEGLSSSVYKPDNMRVEQTRVNAPVPVTTWRSVGHSINGFVIEGFVDELARASKQDPLEFRRKMLPEGSRARRVMDAVAKLSGWGTPLPAGIGRGLARHESFETEVAEVAEVELVKGRIKVRRVFCVVDCGVAVNPDIVRAQMEGCIIFGLSAALDQEITLVDGVVQQRNFDTFPPLRMFESPEIIVEILDSDAAPTGVGEPGLPPIAAAVSNAIFSLTGVRLRRLPLQRAWNEEAPR